VTARVHRTADEAAAAAEALVARLRDHPDVLGVGIGYRERRKGRQSKRCCLIVKVPRKLDKPALHAARSLPSRFRGFAVDVVEAHGISPWATVDPSARADRLLGGIQGCGAGQYQATREVGTLGCAMVDAAGTAFLLSAWHTLYGAAGADGQRVYQPRPASTNWVGWNHVGIHTPQVDCALVRVNAQRHIDPVILGWPSVRLRAGRPARRGESVRKMGVNGAAFGIVDSVGVPVTISGLGALHDQLFIRPRTTGLSLAFRLDKQDSGAVWVADDDDAVVGLHIAGTRDGSQAVANRMENVISALGAAGTQVDVA
jgi:hypothetical protein